MQIHLNFFDAKHFGNGFVVENYFIFASTLKVANFRVFDAINTIRTASVRNGLRLVL